jgi:tetratricopeptide (TPR) repeat protein
MVTDNAPLRRLLACAGSLVLALLLVHASPAQQPPPNAGDVKALLREAHAKSKSAKTVEDYTELIQTCEQALQQGLPDDLSQYAKELFAWAHNRRGELYAEQAGTIAEAGREDEAVEFDTKAMKDFEKAVELNPDYWKATHNRGVSYAVAQRFDEAIADFTRVVELKPDYLNAWFNRAEIHFEHGRYEEAAADYGKAIELKPDDYDALLRRGHALFHLRRFREALADYDRTVELAPEKIESLVNRGDAYRNLGQWREAAEDYRKAILLDHQSGRAYQSAAWLMATCPDQRYRNDQLAVQAAEKAIELDGREDFRYLDTLAAAQASSGEFEKARTTIADAIKVAPEEQREALQRRLALYQGNRPFRERY